MRTKKISVFLIVLLIAFFAGCNKNDPINKIEGTVTTAPDGTASDELTTVDSSETSIPGTTLGTSGGVTTTQSSSEQNTTSATKSTSAPKPTSTSAPATTPTASAKTTTTNTTQKTTAKPTATTKKPTTTTGSSLPSGFSYYKELVLDQSFKGGFNVHGTQHADGYVGKIRPNSGTTLRWTLAQWACRYDIFKGQYSYNSNGYEMKTASQHMKVTYGQDTSRILLRIDASKEYDSPRVNGQAWPHLLVSQDNLASRGKRLSEVDQVLFKINAKANCVDYMDGKADPGLHGAQAAMFLIIQDQLTYNFYWFGIPMYDNRTEFTGEFFAKDGGKDDASGKLIFTVAQNKLTKKSLHSGDWVKYDVDLLPYIKEGISRGAALGYLDSADLSRYKVGHFNIGLEMFGTYDLNFEFEELSLILAAKK